MVYVIEDTGILLNEDENYEINNRNISHDFWNVTTVGSGSTGLKLFDHNYEFAVLFEFMPREI